LKELAMRKVIMIGCDLHEESMILKIAEDRQTPETQTVKNTASGRAAMIADLRRRAEAADGTRVIFAYEASGQGFGLYDQLAAAGMECHVLAPTKIARSPRGQKEKTDEKDALDLLELLRGHVLAGNRLPTVWIPDAQTRDDRELVRMRLDVGEKITALKAQVQSLLKRYQLRRGPGLGKGWTKAFRGWLQRELADPILASRSPLGAGGQAALASLLRQLQSLEEEEERLDKQVAALACSPRYEARVREVTKLCGVGMLTAIVFLSELGDLSRFANRRQIAAYLGLVPRERPAKRPERPHYPPGFVASAKGALPGYVGSCAIPRGRKGHLRADQGQESQKEENRGGGWHATVGHSHVASGRGRTGFRCLSNRSDGLIFGKPNQLP
jgi:transposase